MIVLADEIGDNETRDETVRILLRNYRKPAPKACQVYEILRKTFHDQAKPVSVDLNAIEELLRGVSAESRSLNCWLVGMYLKNHGKPEDAWRVFTNRPPVTRD